MNPYLFPQLFGEGVWYADGSGTFDLKPSAHGVTLRDLFAAGFANDEADFAHGGSLGVGPRITFYAPSSRRCGLSRVFTSGAGSG